MHEQAEESDRAKRSRRAFDRTLRGERDVIVLHERAAALHEATAARPNHAGLTTVDLVHAGALREHAAAVRDRAGVARARAAGVRARLTAAGVDHVAWTRAR